MVFVAYDPLKLLEVNVSGVLAVFLNIGQVIELEPKSRS